ncbi:ABC transporter ATP-binding protein/permease [Ruminococcaceae bacterium OttesenSCG-928-D13]|nr:ABC transporter ATP-binding protein/permease [Ruminococcaceae bacterium OttesenSCG-928-D13]
MKKNKKSNGGVLRFIGRYTAGHRHWLVLAVLAVLVSTTASFLIPQVIRFTVDLVLGSETEGAPPYMLAALDALGGRDSLRANLIWCAGAVVVLSVGGGLFTFASRLCIATGTERFCRDLRERLYGHIQKLPFQWHVENKTGDIIQRCTSDLDVVRNFVSAQLLEVIRTVILIGVALGLMFSMNVTLSLISLAFIPLIGAYSTVFYFLVGKRFLAADEAEGELTINVQENLTGVRVVRAFGREHYELDRFDKYNNGFANLWLKLGRTLSIYWGTGDIATGFQIFTIVVAGAIFAVNGTITLGEFLVFVSYNQSLAWPIRALGRVLSEMSKTGVSTGRLQEILDAEEEPAEPNATKPDLHCDIRFDNVTFSYDKLDVLKDLNFTVPAGSTFGILGATGSGKSTITYLLNRLYDLQPGFGSIWFGDTEIREIDRQYLRRNVGLVLQEPFLYSKTIEENIAIADQVQRDDCRSETADFEIDRRRVRRAAGIAAVDDAISEFTKGYDTVVGERGVTLSGGQKQRVAIARTLMLEAPVMVFDDSMSAVDLETDAKIRAALKEGTGASTVILISHRINTLMAADNIMVLEDGRVADIGTHAELIRRPGPYKRIYDMQSEAAADAGQSLEEIAAGGADGAANTPEGGGV